MKQIIKAIWIGLFVMLPPISNGQTFESELVKFDRDRAEQSILEWADSIFFYHEGYKFTDFKSVYKSDFLDLLIKLEELRIHVDSIQNDYQNGHYVGELNAYDSILGISFRKYSRLKYIVENYEPRAKYYEVKFWSSLGMRDGRLIYCAIRLRLSHNFLVMSAVLREAESQNVRWSNIKFKS